MTISSQTRKAGPFNGNNVTTAFPFTFKVFSAADVYVVEADDDDVESVLTLNSDYTVSLNANQNTNPGGTVTLGAALATGHTLVLTSAVSYLQPTDLTNQGGFYPKVINDALDRLTILVQQTQEEVDRSAKLPITSAADAAALVADIVLLADNVTPINTVAGAISSVQTVATNIADVNTVAGIAAEVSAVGSNIAAVLAVDANEANINAVAGDLVDIGVVAGISASVQATAAIDSEIVAVAGNATNINAVAGNAADITAVAGNATNINAVAGNATNINTVAGIDADVTAVAGIAANVTAVASNATNVNTVAGSISNVNAVGNDIANVNTAATNMAAIIAAPTAATTATTQASAASLSASAAAASAASAAAIVNISSVQFFTNPLAKAIRVALAGSASVRGLQALDDADLDMGTNDFTVFVQKRITTTRPAANEILYHKHDGTTGIIVTLLTTGILRLTINGFTYDSTAALASASNVEPVIMIPTVRETSTTAGSVTFVVDGVQLGDALAIAVPAEKVTNGTFDTDLTGWTLATSGTGTIAWNSGKMRVARVGGSTSGYQAVSMAAGETRYFTATVTHVSGPSSDAKLSIREGAAITSTLLKDSNELLDGASGTVAVSYTAATAQTIYIHATAYGADGTKDFDNITSIPSTYSVDNASNLYVCGTSTTTTEGDYLDGGLYNRALSVAECLAYCVRGPALADIGGSQTATWTSNFGAGVDGFVTISSPSTVTANVDGVSDGTTSKDNCLRIDKTATAGVTGAAKTSGTLLPNMKNAWAKLSVYIPAGQAYIDGFIIVRSSTVSAATTIFDGTGLNGQWVDVSGAVAPIGANTNNDRLYIYALDGSSTTISGSASGELMYIAEGSFGQAGVCGHWPAAEAQGRTGQVFDRSGNKNHMLLPASGATIIGRPADRGFEVRSELTWSASSALQYLTGTNQNILDSDAVISEVLAEISGTPVDGTLGDGSDADRYCTLAQNTGLIAGFNFLALAARTNDGTNRKLTWTPSASFTGTITFTVRGFIRE